jgi:Cu/Ag efflux pump CusA
MGGTITSTFLTLLVVPLLYYKMMRGKENTSESNLKNEN